MTEIRGEFLKGPHILPTFSNTLMKLREKPQYSERRIEMARRVVLALAMLVAGVSYGLTVDANLPFGNIM